MILAFPEVCDALTQSMGLVLGADVVFDGPPVRDVSPYGLAIGATREDDTSSFVAAASDLAGGISESLTVTCLAWSGSGDTVFKPARDQVRDIVAAVSMQLQVDRTLAGAVSTADITGGTWAQEQTGEGALVTCEFRINVQQY
jgi:hypothetical protein